MAEEEKQLLAVDRISQLPDDVLIFILSLFTLEQSVVTSVLSKRWIHLWKHTTHLNFDASLKLLKTPTTDLLLQERNSFVNWINRVLELHRSSAIQQLRVRFDFDFFELDRNINYLDTLLISFAISRKVEKLELDFSNTNPYKKASPPLVFARKFESFQSLRVLSLTGIWGGNIEHFLHNCPCLEHLSIRDSGYIRVLRFVGPFLASLKYMEIRSSPCIKCLDISNLTSLKTLIYDGIVANLYIKNVPSLTDLKLLCASLWTTETENDRIAFYRYCYLPSFAEYQDLVSSCCCFSQLEILEMAITAVQARDGELTRVGFPVLRNLKELSLKNPEYRHPRDSLLEYTYLVERCPNLRKFVFHTGWCDPFFTEEEDWITGKDLRSKLLSTNKMDQIFPPHLNLEVLEFGGFVGARCDLELITYFLEKAVCLKKIVIDPSSEFGLSRKEAEREWMHTFALRHVERDLLDGGLIPAGIQLEFIPYPG